MGVDINSLLLYIFAFLVVSSTLILTVLFFIMFAMIGYWLYCIYFDFPKKIKKKYGKDFYILMNVNTIWSLNRKFMADLFTFRFLKKEMVEGVLNSMTNIKEIRALASNDSELEKEIGKLVNVYRLTMLLFIIAFLFIMVLTLGSIIIGAFMGGSS